MSSYIPFPVGTVRGPYFTSHGGETHVQFLVNGTGGWVPFSGDSRREREISERAHRYAEQFSVEVPLGHS
jgi:hypothetical protein